MKSVCFKRADITDAEAIASLVNSAYRGEGSREGWTTEAELLGGQRTDTHQVEQILNSRDSVVLLAQRSTSTESATTPRSPQIIGCVHLEKQGSLMTLGMLAIHPPMQGAGVGRQLIEASTLEARAWGCVGIEMTVISVRKELIAWYERLGFKVTSEKRPFPMQDPRFGIPKVEHLEFIVLRKTL